MASEALRKKAGKTVTVSLENINFVCCDKYKYFRDVFNAVSFPFEDALDVFVMVQFVTALLGDRLFSRIVKIWFASSQSNVKFNREFAAGNLSNIETHSDV